MLERKSIEETAHEMFLSTSTVKNMRHAIFDKLGVHSQKELVLAANPTELVKQAVQR